MNDKFRVIRIIDDTSLVVNCGLEDGVKKGDKMQICGVGATIVDPETKEELGHLDIVKAKLNVSEVYEKMSVCETPYVSTYFSTLLSTPLFNSTQEKMDVEPTEILGDGDKTIRVGDIAKLIKIQKIEDKAGE